ncbi:hypothetical protein ES703_47558 [subsurface metagenome]
MSGVLYFENDKTHYFKKAQKFPICFEDEWYKIKIDEIDKKFTKKFENMQITIDIQSWDRIIQNRMVKNFVQKTMELDNRLRTKVFEIAFPIFSDILK